MLMDGLIDVVAFYPCTGAIVLSIRSGHLNVIKERKVRLNLRWGSSHVAEASALSFHHISSFDLTLTTERLIDC
jgi:hypothetical protein